MHLAYETHLSCDVAVRIEETEWIVCTAEHSNTNFCNIVVSIWCCLRSSEGRLVVRVADIELIIVSSIWLQVLCFNLRSGQQPQHIQLQCRSSYFDCEVDIGAGVNGPRINCASEVPVCCNLVLDTNGRL